MLAPSVDKDTNVMFSFATARIRTLLVLALLSTAGCNFVQPADLTPYESHPYAGRSRAQVYQATLSALQSMGYDIFAQDSASGTIRAQGVVIARERGNNDTLVWHIDVSATPTGALLHAVPHLFYKDYEASGFNPNFADRIFRTLYAEVDRQLMR
jgi:hypothetical protein